MTFTNTSKAVLVLNGRLIDPSKSIFVSDDNLKSNAHKILQYCVTNKGIVKDITGKQMSVEALKEYINYSSVSTKNEQVEKEKDDYLDILKETIKEEEAKEKPVVEVEKETVKVEKEKEEPVTEVKEPVVEETKEPVTEVKEPVVEETKEPVVETKKTNSRKTTSRRK